MEIKDIIKQKRIEHGYTMKELAQMVGVSEATVSRWESGNLATMKHTKIMLLSNALGISPAALFDSAPEPPAQTLKLTDQEKSMIKKYRQLNADGKLVLDNQIDFMLYKQEQSVEKEEQNLG